GSTSPHGEEGATRDLLAQLSRHRAAALARAKARRLGLLRIVQQHHVALQRAPPVVACGIAVHTGRLHALVPDAGPREIGEPLHPDTLEREDCLLSFRPSATVVADDTVRAHDAMARDAVRNRIVRQCRADGANLTRTPG